jgi:tetratricopeptide (TPR) repeat protein
VSPRARVFVVVALAAVAAAGAAIAVAVLQRDDSAEAFGPLSGDPPLALELGVRTDAEAQALRRATKLYDGGSKAAAARIFARYSSPDARVGAALARWPNGTVAALQALVRRYPDRALPRLHLGLVLFWQGRRREAVRVLQGARLVEPDSPSAVRAASFLFRRTAAPGLPPFVPNFAPPRALAGMRPDGRLAALARGARRDDVRAKLLYGAALLQLERPLSARRQFDAAVALAPDAAEPQVAAAVARFDKANLSAAFARLGPLSRRFPQSASVRFHLGLLLLWIADVDDARRQLELARRLDPESPVAREAGRFLQRLASNEADRNAD